MDIFEAKSKLYKVALIEALLDADIIYSPDDGKYYTYVGAGEDLTNLLEKAAEHMMYALEDVD